MSVSENLKANENSIQIRKTPVIYNYAFIVYGMGCADQLEFLKVEEPLYNIKYNKIYKKCYAKNEKGWFGNGNSVQPMIINRILNPLNVMHANFEDEVRHEYSPIPEELKFDENETTGGKINKTPKLKLKKTIKKSNSFLKSKFTRNKKNKRGGGENETTTGTTPGTPPATNQITESLLQQVVNLLLINKSQNKSVNIYLFGQSYGGLIINRLCQELQKMADKDESFKSILNRHVRALALNSMMVANPSTFMDVDLVNWMDVGDVALKLNAFEIGFKIPRLSFRTFKILRKNNRLKKLKNMNMSKMTKYEIASRNLKIAMYEKLKIVCMYQRDTNVVWYTNYEKNPQTDKIVFVKPVNDFPFIGNQDQWDRHNKNTYPIINYFLDYGKNNIIF